MVFYTSGTSWCRNIAGVRTQAVFEPGNIRAKKIRNKAISDPATLVLSNIRHKREKGLINDRNHEVLVYVGGNLAGHPHHQPGTNLPPTFDEPTTSV